MEHSNLNVSVACEPGTYKDYSLFTCQSCDSELVPNSDKTACGKNVSLIILGFSSFYTYLFWTQVILMMFFQRSPN